MQSLIRLNLWSVAFFAALAAGICAPVSAVQAQSVETYSDQTLPPPVSSPLQAGQMTLKDVLEAHPAPKPSTEVSATAPLLAPTSSASAENIMLMQGMQSALQAPGASGQPPQLKPPQLQTAEASSTAQTIQPPPAPANSASPNTVYEPGQAPKTLATTASTSTPTENVSSADGGPKATDLEQAPAPLDESAGAAASAGAPADNNNVAQAMRQGPMAAPPPTPEPAAPTSAATPASSSSSTCSPHVETWTKTCAEAGYPSSYIGKITGETRTVCPAGDLQDVWTENSCTPPPDTASGAPAAASSPPAEEQAKEISPETAATASLSETPGESAPPPSAAPETPVESAGTVAPVPAAVPAAASSPATMIASATVDGSCGAANGLASAGKPATDLCEAGQPSDVSGDGPWRWDCQGANGGMTVSCAAAIAVPPPAIPLSASPPPSAAAAPTASSAPEEGKCGMANGMGMEQAPVADLCMKGVASRVNGGGPWSWACSGVNGGTAAACSAAKKADGACGTANGAGSGEMPAADLCTSGYASAVTGEGPWNWTCSGLYGGAPATCSAAAKKDAVCGAATSKGHHDAPADNLCSIGEASSVSGDGPWNWTCTGVNNGATVNCTAPASVSGSCGAANGVAVAEMPADNLCAEGRPTRVTGGGPWNWSCSGIAGGETQSCTAPMTKQEAPPAPAATGEQSAPVPLTASSEGLCGTAANVTSADTPALNLCAGGTAGSVSSEKGNWIWTCAGDSGGASVSCSAPRAAQTAQTENASEAAAAPSNAICGGSAGQGAIKTPAADLCSAGKASIVHGKGPWHWTCTKGKQRASCEAPKMLDAHCGASNGSIQKAAPARGLCEAGTPTAVAGNGPWLWTCVGSGGGASTSCSAASQAQVRVEGACGAAANARMQMAPASNLCDSGVPSSVYGEGPWTWTCSGVNGGVASSCQTQKVVPPAPAPPGPSVNGLCGPANGVTAVVQPLDGLCTSGTTTAVSGEGPWNWNCLGQNSGMTVSCTAPLMPPAPVTGACGTANGLPTLTIPRSGLCAAGISSAVSGQGPWTWSCSGTNGGGAVGCVAPLAVSGGGALPSMTGASSTTAEAPPPSAAPVGPVSSVAVAPRAIGGLVTPRLPSGPLPPLETTGNMPLLPTPSAGFSSPPQASPAPLITAESVSPMITAPGQEPELPADTTPLEPPPMRDTIKPAPALQPPAINAEGNPVPGNRFTLPDEVSTLPFAHGSENIGNDALPVVDKLAALLAAHGNVRVTLTAYAGLDATTAPRDARRLSLGRALAVRDYLTSKGISSARIDVRALGANVPSGDSDRVDVQAN